MKKLIILASLFCTTTFAGEPSTNQKSESIEVQAKIDKKWAEVDYVAAVRLLKACLENQKVVKDMELATLNYAKEKASAQGILTPEVSEQIEETIKQNHEKHMPDCQPFVDAVEKAKKKLDELEQIKLNTAGENK
jgi:hypothetical protein